jgi:hypothetical protein
VSVFFFIVYTLPSNILTSSAQTRPGTQLSFNHQLFLWVVWLYHIYCNFLINGTIVWKMYMNETHIFFVLYSHFLVLFSPTGILHDIIINLCRYSSNKPIVCQTEFGKQILVKTL